MSARCPVCKRLTAAIRDAAGKIVVLPHSPTGGPIKFGETCRVRR